MTTEIRFYHLERSTLDQALPLIVTKAYEKGHRVLIRTVDQGQAKHIDSLLWTANPESFLPHEVSSSSKDPKANPICITDAADNPNEADVLVSVGDMLAEDAQSFALCCDIFDGAVEDKLKAARGRWKSYKEQGEATLSYFQQTDRGGWEKKA